jgi:hypothetical protein
MQKNTREAQIKALANFWDSFGAKLCDKLNMTKDPEIFLKKEEDSDFKDYFESIQ